MDLEGKYIAGRYEILQKIGNRRYGNSIQSKMSCIK